MVLFTELSPPKAVVAVLFRRPIAAKAVSLAALWWISRSCSSWSYTRER